MFDPAMRVNRRGVLTALAAAAATTIAPGSTGWNDSKAGQLLGNPRLGIIVVSDTSIPMAFVGLQHQVFLAAIPDTFGLHTAGVGNRAAAASIAGTCNAWIDGMRRRAGVKTVAVLVWTRRHGPMLTIPLKTTADVLMVRAYGESAAGRPLLPRSASVDPITSHLKDLEARLTRNGRRFLLRIEPQAAFQPLDLGDLPLI